MDERAWITLIELGIAGAAAFVGILFAWLRNSILRLDEKIEKHFLHLDNKIEQSNRENHKEIRDVRNQVQGVIKMVSDRQNCKDRSD